MLWLKYLPKKKKKISGVKLRYKQNKKDLNCSIQLILKLYIHIHSHDPYLQIPPPTARNLAPISLINFLIWVMPLYVTIHPSANTSSLTEMPSSPHLGSQLPKRKGYLHIVTTLMLHYLQPCLPSCRCPLHPAWVLMPGHPTTWVPHHPAWALTPALGYCGSPQSPPVWMPSVLFLISWL